MSQKNETKILVLALLITLGLVGGGLWWFTERFSNVLKSSSSNSNSQTQTNIPEPIKGSNQRDQTNLANCPQELNIPSGLFNYGGSTTWATIRRDVDPVIQSFCPQFRLRYINPANGKPGSGSGIQMLLDNQLAFAQSSRSIKAQENESAQQKGFSLKEIPVGIDGIAIAVNPNLNVSGLTVNQLKDIYTGQITNWNQVGGPNIKITPYSRSKEAGGTVDFFVENILDKQNFGENVEIIPTTTQALQKVAANQGGIYYGSAPEVVPQCTIKSLPIGRKSDELVPPYQQPLVPLSQCPNQRNQLNSTAFRQGNYPITRNLFVIIKMNGQTDQKAGEAYANWLLTDPGQALIEKLGFVRIR